MMIDAVHNGRRRWAAQSVRTKYWSLGGIWFVIGGPCLGAAVLYDAPWMLVPVIFLMVVLETASLRIRCPRCGYRVFSRRVTVPPTSCPRCQWPSARANHG